MTDIETENRINELEAEIALVRRQNQNLLDELAERTHEWAALKKELAEYRNRDTAQAIVQHREDQEKLKTIEWD